MISDNLKKSLRAPFSFFQMGKFMRKTTYDALVMGKLGFWQSETLSFMKDLCENLPWLEIEPIKHTTHGKWDLINCKLVEEYSIYWLELRCPSHIKPNEPYETEFCITVSCEDVDSNDKYDKKTSKQQQNHLYMLMDMMIDASTKRRTSNICGNVTIHQEVYDIENRKFYEKKSRKTMHFLIPDMVWCP